MRQAEAWKPGTGCCLPGPLMVHGGTAWPGRRVVQRARAGRDAFVAGRVPVAASGNPLRSPPTWPARARSPGSTTGPPGGTEELSLP
jgi:hypothetical protein